MHKSLPYDLLQINAVTWPHLQPPLCQRHITEANNSKWSWSRAFLFSQNALQHIAHSSLHRHSADTRLCLLIGYLSNAPHCFLCSPIHQYPYNIHDTAIGSNLDFIFCGSLWQAKYRSSGLDLVSFGHLFTPHLQVVKQWFFSRLFNHPSNMSVLLSEGSYWKFGTNIN